MDKKGKRWIKFIVEKVERKEGRTGRRKVKRKEGRKVGRKDWCQRYRSDVRTMKILCN